SPHCVELRVSCRHLLDRDTLNKSDPCVLLLMQSQGQWMEVGGVGGPRRDASATPEVSQGPWEVQKLRFEVYDRRGHAGVGTHDDDFLGGMECTVGQIVAQKRVTKPLFLKYGKFAGKSTITVSGRTRAGSGTGLGHCGGTGLGHRGGTQLRWCGGTEWDMWVAPDWGTWVTLDWGAGMALSWDIWVALSWGRALSWGTWGGPQ
uniref:C2 domain-containing protein n=1 Tax=Bubo bubo TaxID=30461 RepID=A0A8C0E6T8_BUBBB